MYTEAKRAFILSQDRKASKMNKSSDIKNSRDNISEAADSGNIKNKKSNQNRKHQKSNANYSADNFFP